MYRHERRLSASDLPACAAGGDVKMRPVQKSQPEDQVVTCPSPVLTEHCITHSLQIDGGIHTVCGGPNTQDLVPAQPPPTPALRMPIGKGKHP